jgi:predicted alpha/beta superfamily hydrolase
VSFVLHSTVLSGRRLTIYTPPAPLPAHSPAPLSRALPLLLLHDGQNLFEPERALAGRTWRVAETVEALIEAGAIPPMVIAGIDHTGPNRIREFGDGTTYGRFVVDEVLPYLRKTYPVRADFDGTWLGGSSMGGLVTMHIAAHYPDVFGRLFVHSPSVWWKRRVILRTIRRPGFFGTLLGRPHSRGLNAAARIWLSIGLREGEQAVADARKLRDAILTMRAGDASRLLYVEDPEGTHSEDAWAEQFALALRAFSDSSAG